MSLREDALMAHMVLLTYHEKYQHLWKYIKSCDSFFPKDPEKGE